MLAVQDLLDAVEKINSSLSKKEKTKGSNYFHQDEISSLGLGMSIRSCFLLYRSLLFSKKNCTAPWRGLRKNTPSGGCLSGCPLLATGSETSVLCIFS